MILGKIVIKNNKVYFEPDGLEKPQIEDFNNVEYSIIHDTYKKAMREYKASKRVIEVSNVYWTGIMWMFRHKSLFGSDIKDGQSCEAEVNGTAIITKIN